MLFLNVTKYHYDKQPLQRLKSWLTWFIFLLLWYSIFLKNDEANIFLKEKKCVVCYYNTGGSVKWPSRWQLPSRPCNTYATRRHRQIRRVYYKHVVLYTYNDIVCRLDRHVKRKKLNVLLLSYVQMVLIFVSHWFLLCNLACPRDGCRKLYFL